MLKIIGIRTNNLNIKKEWTLNNYTEGLTATLTRSREAKGQINIP